MYWHVVHVGWWRQFHFKVGEGEFQPGLADLDH